MATYFTKSEARAAARASVLAKSSIATESFKILKEESAASKDSDNFDIFLSHSITDADTVLGIKKLLEKLGKTVYVDWDSDPQLDRSKVDAKTADLLRRRMRQSKSLLYLATDAASVSKWMPWELGYFDGFRNGQVAIMPVLDNASDSFKGQEYLGLYPQVTKDIYEGTTTQDVFVESKGRWATFESFSSGRPSWK